MSIITRSLDLIPIAYNGGKHCSKEETENKIISVILSCKTSRHCDACDLMIENFIETYTPSTIFVITSMLASVRKNIEDKPRSFNYNNC